MRHTAHVTRKVAGAARRLGVGAAALWAGGLLAAGCASTLNMPGRVHRLTITADSLSARQERTNAMLGAMRGQLATQEDLLRSSGAGTSSKMNQLLDRSEAVATNLDETTRLMNQIATRMQALEARVERNGNMPYTGGPANDTTVTPMLGPAASDSTAMARRLIGEAAEERLRGQFGKAMASYKRVQQLWPASPLAAEAQYGLGEVHEAQLDWDAALTAYRTVVAGYPSSSRVPAAMLHAATALAALGDKPASTETLQSLIAAYPETPEAAAARQTLGLNPKAAAAKPPTGKSRRK